MWPTRRVLPFCSIGGLASISWMRCSASPPSQPRFAWMRPWISTLLDSPVRTVISPEPVWTSRSTAPVTVSVRSKWPSSLASAGLAAIAAASESTSASNTGKVRVPILIFHPPEQVAPNSNQDTQTMCEKFRGGEGRLGRLAVALFVLLAGAAGAGIVAAHFGAGAGGLGSFDRRVAGLKLHLLFLAALPAFNLFGRKLRKTARHQRFLRGRCSGLRDSPRRLLRRPHQEEEAQRFCITAIHQLIEEYERFLSQFDQWVFLAVPAQADAFFQVVECEEMVFPLAVHDV